MAQADNFGRDEKISASSYIKFFFGVDISPVVLVTLITHHHPSIRPSVLDLVLRVNIRAKVRPGK
jgi:hypothetical protein